MTETIELKGGELAAKIRASVSAAVLAYKEKGVLPRLTAVLAGSDASVLSYVEVKRRLAEKLGIIFEVVTLPQDVSQMTLEAKLDELSLDPSIHGIVLELPLPQDIDVDKALLHVAPAKDIDGMTPHNLGLALAGHEEGAILAATAEACIALAESCMPLEGKKVAMVGKGRTVGKPLIPLLMNRHATLTVCHAKTADLKSAIRDCDIIFTGVGKPGLINKDVIREGQIIIDAGTTMVGGKLLGDAADDVRGIAATLTPVPEGVGPLTTAFIFQNLIKALALQNK